MVVIFPMMATRMTISIILNNPAASGTLAGAWLRANFIIMPHKITDFMTHTRFTTGLYELLLFPILYINNDSKLHKCQGYNAWFVSNCLWATRAVVEVIEMWEIFTSCVLLCEQMKNEEGKRWGCHWSKRMCLELFLEDLVKIDRNRITT